MVDCPSLTRSPIRPRRTRVSLGLTPLLLRLPTTRTPSATPEQGQDSRWVARSFTDLPLPEDAPGTPVVDPSSLPGLSASSYRGILLLPFPALVSGLAPSVRVVNSDMFARARMAAVQSRVAAPVVSDPRAPPPTSAFPPFHGGSYWCSKCPRKGFQSAKGLMRHITHHHTGSVVDEDTCALFVAVERVTCSTPS